MFSTCLFYYLGFQLASLRKCTPSTDGKGFIDEGPNSCTEESMCTFEGEYAVDRDHDSFLEEQGHERILGQRGCATYILSR